MERKSPTENGLRFFLQGLFFYCVLEKLNENFSRLSTSLLGKLLSNIPFQSPMMLDFTALNFRAFSRIRRMPFIGLACLILALFSCTDCVRGQSETVRVTTQLPNFPDAITTIPEWTRDLAAPFGLRTYFSAPAGKDNGATHYLIAMREFCTDVDTCFQPKQIFNTDEVRQRQNVISQYYDDFDLFARFSDLEAKRKLIKSLATGFSRVKLAQAQTKCVFQTNFDLQQPHHNAALILAKAYLIKTTLDAKSLDWEEAIDNVRRTLKIARDLLPRGNAAAAKTALQIEDIACRRMIPIILMEKRNTKPSYCDRLIQILVDHQSERQASKQIAIASEWLRIQVALNESKANPSLIDSARADTTRWFNECYLALQEPPRTQAQALDSIHAQRLAPHRRLFRSRSLAEVAWLGTTIDTQTDLVVGMCAVRKHYMTSRLMPRSLEKLFAELPVKTPPLDRMRSGSLRRDPIKANFGGDFGVIYSVGVDGNDGNAEQGSDDMAILIETTGLIKFLSDPFREAAKPRD